MSRANGGRFYATAYTAGAEPNKGTYRPSLSGWLSHELADTLPKLPILPLYSWWNNLATFGKGDKWRIMRFTDKSVLTALARI